jgi:hypothetical protein
MMAFRFDTAAALARIRQQKSGPAISATPATADAECALGPPTVAGIAGVAPLEVRKRKALGRLDLRDVDVKEADGVALELLPLGFVALDIRKPRDAVTLQAAMQRRPRQVRDRWLQGIEAVVQRQERVPSKGDDCRLLFLGQDRRARFLRPGLHVFDRRALSPPRYGLGIDAEFPAQLRERSLRSLYRCSDGVRGRGAPVTNLSHSASFHSCERIAPSNHGIKDLADSVEVPRRLAQDRPGLAAVPAEDAL